MKPTDKICPFLNRRCLGVACAIFTFWEDDDGECSIRKIGYEIENIRRIEQKIGGY
jgi:hypothetical protein